jgi:diguanylate cyclase (GGDEF)-like protein
MLSRGITLTDYRLFSAACIVAIDLGWQRGFAVGDGRAANDDGGISLDEAIALLDEIERLRAQLAAGEARLVELDRLAHRDPLVDLPNRRSFIANLEHLIARVERYGFEAAMLFVDVDGLKAINDRFGHNAGDKALVQVARLIVASVRKADFVARLAGDEFGILLEHADELSAWKMALRVIETVDDCEFCVGGAGLPLSVAIGVGMIAGDDTPETVLARADTEMYRIKAISNVETTAG